MYAIRSYYVDEKILTRIQNGTKEDAIKALESAEIAQKEWAKLPALV